MAIFSRSKSINTSRQDVKSSKTSLRVVSCLLLTLVFLYVITNQNISNETLSIVSSYQQLLDVTNDTVVPATASSSVIQNDLIKTHGDYVWEKLLSEGKTLLQSSSSAFAARTVMEVGMHKADQCFMAASVGFTAHCLEPSPASYKRVRSYVESKKDPVVRQRIHTHQLAAGGTTGDTVPFVSAGKTGDHVGLYDMWTMEEVAENTTDKKIEHVRTIRLDDMILNSTMIQGPVYFLKIDTQGFEPTVFSGLQEALKRHAVQFILFEYWPKGMDRLHDAMDQCLAATILQDLLDHGYMLFTMSVIAHPNAPKAWQSVKDQHTQPLHSTQEHCRYFYQMEEWVGAESKDYKFGYWTDVLAVAPEAQLPDTPTTSVGRAVKQALQRTLNS